MVKIFFQKLSIILIITLCFICDFQAYGKAPAYKNPTGDDFPIVAWSTFRKADNITVNNFLNIKEGGFNISMDLVGDMKLTEQSLRCANSVGIKVMVNCPQTRNLNSIPSNIPLIRNNNAVMGYFIYDEPTVSKFREIKKIMDAIYKADPNHIPFVNLYPITDPSRLEARNYKDYLLKFINIVNPPLFSFDNYPILKKKGKIVVKDNFYENLEIAAEVSKETNRPFWAFCMCAPHFSYPTPTLGELQFEAFSAMAYGAQGISYYTYSVDVTQKIEYTGAPVDANGKKTKIWDLCRKNNLQIQALSKVFLGCKLQNVWHTGKNLPQGTRRLGKLPAPFTSLKTGDTGVLVSHITNNGKNYMVVVSHDVVKRQNVEIIKENSVTRILPDGREVYDNNKKYTLEPGGYLIFSWK